MAGSRLLAPSAATPTPAGWDTMVVTRLLTPAADTPGGDELEIDRDLVLSAGWEAAESPAGRDEVAVEKLLAPAAAAAWDRTTLLFAFIKDI